MQKINPFLSFDTQAEEAAKFYTSVFPDSEIISISRYGDFDPKRAGQVMTVVFTVRGEEFVALNGGPQFAFNESISFVVNCETQQEIDEYWAKLTDGGQEIVCGWLKDRYGLAWQIVPAFVWEAMKSGNAAGLDRMMRALMKMTKLDAAELRRAFEGK